MSGKQDCLDSSYQEDVYCAVRLRKNLNSIRFPVEMQTNQAMEQIVRQQIGLTWNSRQL